MGATVFHGGLSKKMLDAATKALRDGELIIYPTDTIYGIGCDMRNGKALEKLNRLKNRPSNKPFSFICNNISEAAQYARLSNAAHRVMKRFLPGPYTFILPVGSGVPKKMTSAEHTVGIRIPNHFITLELAKAFGSPIITTSVNLSGDAPVCAIGDLPPEFTSAVSVIIDGGPLEYEPSTIINFVGEAPVVEREGRGFAEIKPFLETHQS
ncbi:MAG: threonylcarbamoyl-AMP synthase [Nitrospinae bacterium]|nr:threonylcarbamoyl-AMP synthase [Nitrospinota bacterium]